MYSGEAPGATAEANTGQRNGRTYTQSITAWALFYKVCVVVVCRGGLQIHVLKIHSQFYNRPNFQYFRCLQLFTGVWLHGAIDYSISKYDTHDSTLLEVSVNIF